MSKICETSPSLSLETYGLLFMKISYNIPIKKCEEKKIKHYINSGSE